MVLSAGELLPLQNPAIKHLRGEDMPGLVYDEGKDGLSPKTSPSSMFLYYFKASEHIEQESVYLCYISYSPT